MGTGSLTLIHVFGDLWLLVLAILHHIVDMTHDRVDRVLDLDIEWQKRDDVLVLYLRECQSGDLLIDATPRKGSPSRRRPCLASGTWGSSAR